MYFGGANLYEENGLYYLVGEGEKVGGISGCFNFYRSPDLSTWTNLGCLLNISDIIVPPPFDNSTFRRGFGHGLRMERPKIFKCPTAAAGIAAYRLVFHCDTRNFNMRSIGVLVAEQVEGPYEQRVPCFKPDGEDSYDMGTFVDEAARGGDGNVYLIRSVQNQYAGISAFDRECMNTTGIVSHGPSIEGQALMRSGGGGGAAAATTTARGGGGGGGGRETTRALFVAGSHLTGWNPNPAVFGATTSQNLPGATWPAMDQYNPSGNPTTWNTQSSFIFPFSHADGSGTTFVWMADRWNEGGTDVLPGGLDNWTSVWLPLVPPQSNTSSGGGIPQSGWELRLAACEAGDPLQQFTLGQGRVKHHASGLCVERAHALRSSSVLTLAKCNDSSDIFQHWVHGANGSISTGAVSTSQNSCVAWVRAA